MLEQKCNKCGKIFDAQDVYNQFGIHQKIENGSAYHGEEIDLDLCCACFDELIDEILPKCKLNPVVDAESKDL